MRNHREQYKHLILIVASTLLVLIQGVLFLAMLYFVYRTHYFWVFWRLQTIANVGLYLLFMMFFTRLFGGYKVGYLKINDVCMSQVMAIIAANVVEYVELSMIYRQYIFVSGILGLTVLEILIAILWAYVVKRIYIYMYPAHQMLFIHGQHTQAELISKMDAREEKYSIKATLDIDEPGMSLGKIYERVDQYKAVVIADIPSSWRNDILKYCYGKGIRTYITPKISDILIGGEEKIHLFDTPLLLGRNYGLTAEQQFAKRAMDLVVSALLLILLSPIMLLVAIAIKLEDASGPVFYRQERLTFDRQVFRIFKFRSMRAYRGVDEDRLTKVGKFIRKTHLDEVPQLINILRGEMSFVGPRPLVEDDYINDIPEFAFRLKTKAGLTGYAQVYGHHNTSDYDKLKLDLFYIANYSIWLDIKIMLMTVKAVFRFDEGDLKEHSKVYDK